MLFIVDWILFYNFWFKFGFKLVFISVGVGIEFKFLELQLQKQFRVALVKFWVNGLVISCFWEVIILANGLIWGLIFYCFVLKLNKGGLEEVKSILFSDLAV